ncbi:hypothetical protein IH981_04250 [Patescibacteria group bacterium]|nr:hypothetical protein [Patescibacteria group bacterium]
MENIKNEGEGETKPEGEENKPEGEGSEGSGNGESGGNSEGGDAGDDTDVEVTTGDGDSEGGDSGDGDNKPE